MQWGLGTWYPWVLPNPEKGEKETWVAIERSCGEEPSNPLQYSCLENPHGPRSLVGYSPQDHKESGTAEVTEHACPERSWLQNWPKASSGSKARWWRDSITKELFWKISLSSGKTQELIAPCSETDASYEPTQVDMIVAYHCFCSYSYSASLSTEWFKKSRRSDS